MVARGEDYSSDTLENVKVMEEIRVLVKQDVDRMGTDVD